MMAAQPSGEDELARVAAFRGELRRFLRRTETVATRAGLTSQRYDLLLMIKSAGSGRGGVRVTALCDLLHLRQTAVTELVKRAEDAKLIVRRASPRDGRSSLLSLTAEGERRLFSAFDALRGDRQLLVSALSELEQRLGSPDASG